MTYKEYIDANNALFVEQQQLSLAMRNLQKSYLQAAPFQPGQKVLVTNKDGEQMVLYVSAVHPGGLPDSFGGYVYTFNKCAADGTMSDQRARVGFGYTVENAD